MNLLHPLNSERSEDEQPNMYTIGSLIRSAASFKNIRFCLDFHCIFRDGYCS